MKDPKGEHGAFGRLLRESRLTAGWNQTELADRLGTSQQSIVRWESGRDLPRPPFVRKMADLFAWAPDRVAVATGMAGGHRSADPRRVNVVTAINADPSLSPPAKKILIAAYRAAKK